MSNNWRAQVVENILKQKTIRRRNARLLKGYLNINTITSPNIRNKMQNAIRRFNAQDPWLKFRKELTRLVNNTNNLKYSINGNQVHVYVNHPNGTHSYVNYEPAGNNRSAYIDMGETSNKYRQGKFGTRLRNIGVQAARASGVPLYQYSLNLGNVGYVQSKFGGKTPVSGHIMEKLGAVRTRGIPSGKGKMEKKHRAYLVRAHRYNTRTMRKK